MKNTVDDMARVGWAHPTTSKVAHYFHGQNSVCGKWSYYTGPLLRLASELPLPIICKVCASIHERHEPLPPPPKDHQP